MNDKEKIKQMEKTLRYAYKDIDYLLKTGHNTTAETVTIRLYSSISNGDLDSVANTLADIKDLLDNIKFPIDKLESEPKPHPYTHPITNILGSSGKIKRE